MKYIIYKSQNLHGKTRHKLVGTLEASSLEIASDLIYKKFRKSVTKKNGETYLIVPYTKDLKVNQNTFPRLEGLLYSVVQYREVGGGLLS